MPTGIYNRKTSKPNKGTSGFKYSEHSRFKMRVRWAKRKGIINPKIPKQWTFCTQRIDSNGYYVIHRPEHHLANKSGYIFVHRLIAEIILSRKLKKEEIVHHLNGNRTDNRPENLAVITQSIHCTHHMLKRHGKQNHYHEFQPIVKSK